MVRKNLAEVGANLRLTEYLGSIEPDDVAVRREQQRKVTRVPLVPCFQELAIQLAGLPVHRGVDRFGTRHSLSSLSASANLASIRRSGINHISATDAYIASDSNWCTNARGIAAR